jgi:fucose 4-O-acetylase-like acetyltransferase
MNTSVTRRVDIDCAKGLGIFLVVLGHLAAKTQPADNAWYTVLQTGIYTFHMPFFVYLSGYVAFITGVGDAQPGRWRAIFSRRAERLLLPFVLFGALLFTGKLVAAQFMYVDNRPSLNLESVLNLVWNTDNSPAISIWYMYVIFLAAVVTPVLVWLARGSRLLALAVSLALFLIGMPHHLFMDRFAEYYLFFMMGALAADAGEAWTSFIDRYRWVTLAALGIVLLVLFSQPSFDPHWSHLLCGTLSLAALHGLVRWEKIAHSSVLLYLGIYSFVIYLLNTPAIGLAKGLLIKWVPWDGPTFIVHAILLLASGIFIPVLIKRLLFRKWRYLDRLTD